MDSTTPPRIWFMVLRTARGVTYVRMGKMYNRLTSITKKPFINGHTRTCMDQTLHSFTLCACVCGDRFGGFEYGNMWWPIRFYHMTLSTLTRRKHFDFSFFHFFLIENQSATHDTRTRCIHNFTHDLRLAYVYLSIHFPGGIPITCELFQSFLHTNTSIWHTRTHTRQMPRRSDRWSPNNGVDRLN